MGGETLCLCSADGSYKMKLKHLFYKTRILWEHHQYFTMKGWLKFKDRILLKRRYQPLILSRYGIKLQPKYRHRRSFFRCKLPQIVGNRAVYRLFKATVWYKEPNVKYRREEGKIIEDINVDKKNRV